MSALANPDPLTPKKKGGKKKKGRGKGNGEAASERASGDVAGDSVEGEGEELQVAVRDKPIEEETGVPNTDGAADATETRVNGHKGGLDETATAEEVPSIADSMPDVVVMPSHTSNGANTSDASTTLESLSASREALRVQVEELRAALSSIQETHTTELSTIKAELTAQVKAREQENEETRQRLEREREELVEQHAEEREAQSMKVRETIKKIQVKLGRFHDLEGENEVLEGRVAELQVELERERANHSSSGEQVEELGRAINDLRKENREQQEMVNRMAQQIGNLSEENSRLGEENRGFEKEVNSLRSTQNELFLQNRTLKDTQEELVAQNRHLKEEANVAREECEEWREQMEYHRQRSEELSERVQELEPLSEQCETLKSSIRSAEAERRNIMEEWQQKFEGLRKELEDRDVRTQGAEDERDVLAKRLEGFEEERSKDIKKKDEEIAEFRQKWIMEREAVKKVQRENRRLAKINPVDYIEKQIVTSHLTKFLSLDRADPTRFQILQALSGMLSWSESDNEKAGLARPGAAAVGSASALRVPSLGALYRTPSSPNLGGEFVGGAGGRSMDGIPETPMSGGSVGSTRGSLWGFIGRASTSGSRAGSVSGDTVGGKESVASEGRSASISSVPPK